MTAPPEIPGCTGTYGSWKRGCRCQTCVEATRAVRRAYKARRKERSGEADIKPYCPLCEIHVDSWRSQAQHERMAHGPKR